MKAKGKTSTGFARGMEYLEKLGIELFFFKVMNSMKFGGVVWKNINFREFWTDFFRAVLNLQDYVTCLIPPGFLCKSMNPVACCVTLYCYFLNKSLSRWSIYVLFKYVITYYIFFPPNSV